MASPQYTYICVDITTNTIVGDLELSGVSYTSKISAAGDGSGTVSTSLRTSVAAVKEVTTPGRVAVYFLRNGSPLYAGIIWKRTYSVAARSVVLALQSFESYFYHRFQNQTKVFVDTDQLDIARSLINPIAPDIQMSVAGTLSGVRRDRVMFDYEFNTRGDELDRLGGLENGFDYNVVIGLDPATGSFTRRLEFGYPYLGLSADQSSLLFDYPGNISDFTADESADGGGNSVTAIGGGDGEDQLEYTAQDTISLQYGFPLLETSRSYKSVVSPSTLQAHAQEDLKRLDPPVAATTMSVRSDLDPELGTYRSGDYARFRIVDDWYGGIQEFKSRITGFTVGVSDSGGPESVALSFDEVEKTTDDTTVY